MAKFYCLSTNILALLLINLWQGATDATDPGPSSRNQSEHGESSNELAFSHLYYDVLSSEAAPLEPRAALAKLKQARTMLDTMNLRIDNCGEVSDEVDKFIAIADDTGCDSNTLRKRLELAHHCREHPNLGPYMIAFNKEQFERCVTLLNDKLAAQVDEYVRGDISRATQFVRELQQTEVGYQRTLSMAIDFKSLARGLIDYLAVMGHGIEEKPIDRSMNEQNLQFNQVLSDYFDKDCENLIATFSEDLIVFRLILDHDRAASDSFRPDVEHLVDQVHVCAFLMEYKGDIYPMGKYDFEELTDQILSTQPRVELMDPRKIRDLLDISLFVGQALLVIDNANDYLLSRFRDYLTVSQVSSNKCSPEYIKAILIAKSNSTSYPNLSNYLDFYGELQMIDCLPQLLLLVNGSVPQLDTAQCDLNMIDDLAKAFELVAQQVDGNIRLYKKIPYTVVRLGLEKYLHQNGFNLSVELNDNYSNSSQSFKPKLMELFKSCKLFAENLQDLYQRFQDLVKLDTIPDEATVKMMNPSLLTWMSKYKVCKTIASLPPRIEFVEHNN